MIEIRRRACSCAALVDRRLTIQSGMNASLVVIDGESIQLATYGKMFSITRQAIINDDLTAFTDIPRKMGRAAARTRRRSSIS